MYFLRNFPFVIVILLNLHKMADNKDTECKKVVKDGFLYDLTRICKIYDGGYEYLQFETLLFLLTFLTDIIIPKSIKRSSVCRWKFKLTN